MLSCFLVGVRLLQGVNAVHGKHHISLCDLFMYTGRRRCFCCTLSIFDPLSFTFRFSGDWRDAGARPESSRPLYVFPSSRQCSEKGGEAGSDPMCIFVP